MLYNQQPPIENIDLDLNSTKTLSGIYIYYNSSGLHDYMPGWPFYAPTPLIDISYVFNNDNNNIPQSLTTSINLEGIIYQKKPQNITESYSFINLISGVNNLRQIFTNQPFGTLEVKSIEPTATQEYILHKIEGLSLNEISFDQTEDNWSKSIKYSISLESINSLYSGDNNIEKYVIDRVHTWNIEPIEDYYYTNNRISTNKKQKLEFDNPNINSISTDISNPLVVKDFQQFRVTRKLSAKGIMPPIDKIGAANLLNENTRPYVFAKNWVEKMGKTFKTDNYDFNSFPYFLPIFVSGSSNRYGSSSFPFDHQRTVNIDIFEGIYSVDDSWLVLPRPNPYIETYSVESSSDDSFVKSVSINGNIIGLSIYQDSMNIISLGTGNSGLLQNNFGSLIENLDASIKNEGLSVPNDPRTYLPNINSYGSLDTNTKNRTIIYRSKYENALNGWLHDIKPYLYRRASLAINTDDRQLPYIRDQNPPNPFIPPNNPTYTQENLLSVIPIAATENHNPHKGTIDYSYEFSNRFNIFSGVINENISLSYENSSDNTTETEIIDPTRAPILIRNRRTNSKKTITVDISIMPINRIEQISMTNTECPLHTGNYLWSNINTFIMAHAPYSDKRLPNSENWNRPPYGGYSTKNRGIVHDTSDNETWNPTTGKYSRVFSWIYQPYIITKDHREH